MGIVILNPYRGGTVRTIKANYQKVSLANLIRTDALGATGIMEIYNDETTKVSDETRNEEQRCH